MFEVIAGIFAGLMVKHWSALFVFPCIIGLVQTVSLALLQFRKWFTLGQITQMIDNGMTDDDIQEAEEGLDILNQLTPSGWQIYVHQFVWSSITAFPLCFIIGGIRLLLRTRGCQRTNADYWRDTI